MNVPSFVPSRQWLSRWMFGQRTRHDLQGVAFDDDPKTEVWKLRRSLYTPRNLSAWSSADSAYACSMLCRMIKKCSSFEYVLREKKCAIQGSDVPGSNPASDVFFDVEVWELESRMNKSVEDAVRRGPFLNPFNFIIPDHINYWARFSDWYFYPHLQTFQNIPELLEMLVETDTYEISRRMEDFNRVSLSDSIRRWESLLSKIIQAVESLKQA